MRISSIAFPGIISDVELAPINRGSFHSFNVLSIADISLLQQWH